MNNVDSKGDGARKKANPNPSPPELNKIKHAGLDSRSFRDVLIGKSKHSCGTNPSEVGKTGGGGVTHKSLFDIHIPTKDIAWVDCSLVGVLKQQYDLEFIQMTLLSDGLNARVARWGNFDLSCIIMFHSFADKDEAWAKREEGLSFWFSHVALLLNDNGVPASYLLVSLVGVPLHCWHETFFKSLGDSIEECTKVNEEVNSELDGCNYADVWPVEKPPVGADQRISDHYSQSSPSGGDVPEVGVDAVHQNCANYVDLDPHVIQSSKIIPPVLGKSLETDIHENILHAERLAGEVGLSIRGLDVEMLGANLDEDGANLDFCQDKSNLNILPGFGHSGSTAHECSVRSAGIANGPYNMMARYSMESGGKPPISPTFEFVLDSFEGLENASFLKESSCDLG
ncbi:hypothetical protein V6N13_030800 [Hibiscus sabdariffa]